MNIARYNQILFGLIIIAFLGFFAYSFHVEPLDGDLTRVGGYNEADFGWEEDQAFFEQEFLFTWAHKMEDWDRPYDIIVMGDSFGWRPYNSFTNYLVNMTGKRVLFMHHNQFKLDQIVSSPQFRKWPPELVVFEVVERRLYRRIQGLVDIDLEATLSRAMAPLSDQETAYLQTLANRPADTAGDEPPASVRPKGSYQVDFKPRNKYFSTFNDRMAATIHFSKLQLRTTFFPETKRAFDFPLRDDAPSLFSSRDQERILIYIDDIQYRDQWRKNQDRFEEALRRVWTLGRVGPRTTFVPLVFPDKLTVYAEYLADAKWQNTSLIPVVARYWQTPRLDEAYAEMIRQGVKDIYLPNDSHSGAEGNRVAAEMILRQLALASAPERNSVPDAVN